MTGVKILVIVGVVVVGRSLTRIITLRTNKTLIIYKPMNEGP